MIMKTDEIHTSSAICATDAQLQGEIVSENIVVAASLSKFID